MYNLHENCMTYGKKCIGHKISVAFISKTFVCNNLHFNKYRVSYARDECRNACKSSSEVSIAVVHYNENLECIKTCSKSFHYQI